MLVGAISLKGNQEFVRAPCPRHQYAEVLCKDLNCTIYIATQLYTQTAGAIGPHALLACFHVRHAASRPSDASSISPTPSPTRLASAQSIRPLRVRATTLSLVLQQRFGRGSGESWARVNGDAGARMGFSPPVYQCPRTGGRQGSGQGSPLGQQTMQHYKHTCALLAASHSTPLSPLT